MLVVLDGIFFGSSRESFSKKIVQNGPSIPFKLCKIGLQNTLFIFGREMVVFLIVLFVAILSRILTYSYLKKMYRSPRAEKDAVKYLSSYST